jgi:hypothetical protein
MTITTDKPFAENLQSIAKMGDRVITINAEPALIRIQLHDIEQLFNTMDPSPFHEKDLDADAAEFILSWAEELLARHSC